MSNNDINEEERHKKLIESISKINKKSNETKKYKKITKVKNEIINESEYSIRTNGIKFILQ